MELKDIYLNVVQLVIATFQSLFYWNMSLLDCPHL